MVALADIAVGDKLALPITRVHIQKGRRRSTRICGYANAFMSLFPGMTMCVDIATPEERAKMDTDIAIAAIYDGPIRKCNLVARFRGTSASARFISRFDRDKTSVHPGRYIFKRVA